jgi:hypothetical protein
VNREAYDAVQDYLSKHGGCKVSKALKATKTNAGTYYRQKRLVEESSQGAYEMVTLRDPGPGPGQFFPAKSTVVALVGAPDAVAEALARLGGGR